jgi:argininosuccinate lyase
VLGSLKVFADMIPAMGVKREAMRAAAQRGFATATDLADYLVRKGVAFRDAHEIVGRAVRRGIETGQDLSDMKIEALQAFSPAIDADVYAVLTLDGSVAARNHVGGTAPEQVRAAIKRARKRL